MYFFRILFFFGIHKITAFFQFRFPVSFAFGLMEETCVIGHVFGNLVLKVFVRIGR